MKEQCRGHVSDYLLLRIQTHTQSLNKQKEEKNLNKFCLLSTNCDKA